MRDKLYFIGNGFDIHHGLKTSYANFRDNYAKKSSSLWNLLSDIYGDAIYVDMWWSRFEEMLGRIDYLHLQKSKNGEALGFQKAKNLLKGSLPPLFGSWLRNIKCNVEKDSSLCIERDSLFFSFNYTMLLEKAYGVSEDNVWHIHNSITKPDDIVVGHDSDDRELFIRLNQYRNENPNEPLRMDLVDLVNKEVANGAKKVKERIAQYEERFYNLYSSIVHFVVMGFSLNDIDMPYIEKIKEVNKNIDKADWLLYYHQNGEDILMKEKLIKLGIQRDNILPPRKW